MAAMSNQWNDPFAPSPVRTVSIDLFTDSYRISGKASTRFTRVGDIVNLASSSHLAIAEATISEYASPNATISTLECLVNLDEVLMVIASESEPEGDARPEMRIQKRPVRAQVGVPPFRLTGTIHISPGSRPADGVLNASDRYMPMTEATIACGPHPELGRTAAALAFRRERAHILLLTDDERPDELLADVLDSSTAERWLHAAPEGEES
jgi:hypothetical protein